MACWPVGSGPFMRVLQAQGPSRRTWSGMPSVRKKSGVLSNMAFQELVENSFYSQDFLLAMVLINNLPQITVRYGDQAGKRAAECFEHMLLGVLHVSMVSQLNPALFVTTGLSGGDPTELAIAIQEGIDGINQTKEFPFLLSAAVGVVDAHDLNQPAQDWVNRANLATFESGRLGRPIVFSEGDEVHYYIRDTLSRIGSDLPPPDGMTWVAQPLVDAQSLAVRGYEILCRWSVPGIGPVQPGDFIPLAEEIGAIKHLDQWTLAFVEDHVDVLAVTGEEIISVNVSPAALLGSDSYLLQLGSLAAKLTPTGATLVLELAESSVGHYNTQIVDRLELVRSLGVKVAIDDFGCGETSLVAVAGLECDYLKLDGSILQLPDARIRMGLLRSGREVANLMNAQLIAEGVEGHEHLEDVRNAGADLAQGWYTGIPFEL